MTRQLSPSQIDEAADIIRAGGTLAFPTETVYGLGADARNSDAVAAIYEAKGRPSFNPLIVHVAGIEAADALAVLEGDARALAKAFWPGPLTLVLPLRPKSGIASLVTAGLDTVALRCPDHPVARALLLKANCPIAAPSANPSGRLSPTTAAHVIAGLEGRIDAVIDAGPCEVGLESTILSDAPITVLRSGGLPVEEIEEVLGSPLEHSVTADKITAPGQLLSHYAPKAKLRLNTEIPAENEILIGFGDILGAYNLSENGNLREAASQLFDILHRADRVASQTGKTLAIAPIPETGLGLAINDRLRRAAA